MYKISPNKKNHKPLMNLKLNKKLRKIKKRLQKVKKTIKNKKYYLYIVFFFGFKMYH